MLKRVAKSLIVKGTSLFITTFIIFLLILSGPASAFILSLNIIPDNPVTKGESISFTGEIEINSDENLPIDSLLLKLDGNEAVNCLFYPNGTIISGCKGISIDFLGSASFGYGYGYGYSYGYGYNFGYGYGYTNGKLIYNFTLNTSDYIPGNYSTELTAYIDGESFSTDGNKIIILDYVIPGFGLTVHSPKPIIYNTRRIPFNITATEKLREIEYINFMDTMPMERTLCRDCIEYGNLKKKTKTMHEGSNKIRIIGTNKSDDIKKQDIDLFVDSQKPRILKTSPKKGFADGEFYVEFIEENPKNLTIFYGNSIRAKELNLSNDCHREKNKHYCAIFINLSEFDGKKIEYWFDLTDIAENFDESKKIGLDVDYTPPIINSAEYHLDEKRRGEIIVNITEAYFEEIDLCVRARRKGFKVVYVSEALAYHKESPNIEGKFFLRLYSRNRMRFVINNYTFKDMLLKFLPGEITWYFSKKASGVRRYQPKAYLDSIAYFIKKLL